MADKPSIDWEAVELDYRAGLLSLREIAAQHGITHGAINKRAKRDGWDRDLNARILARAEALVSKQAVSESVSKERLVTEREVIEANAERIAQVRGEHRADITRTRALALKMITELETQTEDPTLYEDLHTMVRGEADPDDKAGVERDRKMREALDRAISLGGRVKALKDLSDTLARLVAMEREAYGITAAAPVDAEQTKIEPLEGARRMAFALRRAAELQQQTVH